MLLEWMFLNVYILPDITKCSSKVKMEDLLHTSQTYLKLRTARVQQRKDCCFENYRHATQNLWEPSDGKRKRRNDRQPKTVDAKENVSHIKKISRCLDTWTYILLANSHYAIYSSLRKMTPLVEKRHNLALQYFICSVIQKKVLSNAKEEMFPKLTVSSERNPWLQWDQKH